MKEPFEITSSIMRPFGPTILKAELPDILIDKLIKLTDEILNQENYPSYGTRLIGQIKNEPAVNSQQLNSVGALAVFNTVTEGYVKEILPQIISDKPGTLGGSSEPKVEVTLKGCWAVSQYENEYNPVHSHGSCQISNIVYLKIPEFKPRNIPGKSNELDGNIEFVHGSSTDLNSLIRPTVRINPKVGDLYVFPNTLLHTVYPFVGKGERRSLSYNMLYKVYDSETGVQVLGDSVNAANIGKTWNG